jgi:uncharacterized protein (TIGR02391 family)
MSSLKTLLPTPEQLFELEPEEIAGFLLNYLQSISGEINKHNLIRPDAGALSTFPYELRNKISAVLTEAWMWLEREGLLAPKPGMGSEGWYFITRRGLTIKGRDDLTAYKKAAILPRKLLHPNIADKIWSLFLRGDYDTAIFQAFKEVEVRVREAGKFTNDDYGVALMRNAFQKDTGLLADKAALPSEQEAISHLFAGAIGYYKNPSSHRNVKIEIDEAVEILILASHLLRIVEDRAHKVT